MSGPGPTRHDWTVAEVLEFLGRPFHDLLAGAQAAHRARFDPAEVEGAVLLSIKTGGCPEDCAYCPQSSRYQTVHQARLEGLDGANRPVGGRSG